MRNTSTSFSFVHTRVLCLQLVQILVLSSVLDYKKEEKKKNGHSETFVFISQCMFIVLLQGLHIYINVDVFINIFIYIYYIQYISF